MKINPINFYMQKPAVYNAQRKSYVSNPISFGEKEYMDFSQAEIDDIEIASKVEKEYAISKHLNSVGKYILGNARNMLLLGVYSDFGKNPPDLNSNDEERVLYGKVSDITDFPESMQIVENGYNLKLLKKYEFSTSKKGPFEYYKLTEYKDDARVEWQMSGKNVISYSIQKEDSDIIETYYPNKDGFRYTEERIKDDYSRELLTEIKVDSSKARRPILYSNYEGKDPIGHYMFNRKTKMWERIAKIDTEA